jgi:hypothetical protein
MHTPLQMATRWYYGKLLSVRTVQQHQNADVDESYWMLSTNDCQSLMVIVLVVNIKLFVNSVITVPKIAKLQLCRLNTNDDVTNIMIKLSLKS